MKSYSPRVESQCLVLGSEIGIARPSGHKLSQELLEAYRAVVWLSGKCDGNILVVGGSDAFLALNLGIYSPQKTVIQLGVSCIFPVPLPSLSNLKLVPLSLASWDLEEAGEFYSTIIIQSPEDITDASIAALRYYLAQESVGTKLLVWCGYSKDNPLFAEYTKTRSMISIQGTLVNYSVL